MSTQKLTIFLIIFFSSLTIVKADWPVGKKRFYLSPLYSFSSTSRYFDANGKIQPSANGGLYTTNTFGLNGSAGISRRLDLYFNVPVTNVIVSDNNTKTTKFGVGDITAGIALHTPINNLKSYFTVKAQVIMPMYDNVTSPYLGYASKGATVAANFSFSPSQKQFAIIEGNLTRYFDKEDGPTQYGGTFNWGFQLPKYQILTFSFNHLNSISSNKIFTPNLNSNKDFMVGRVSASYGKRISRMVTPYLQASYPLYGRNVGQGISGTFFLLIRLP